MDDGFGGTHQEKKKMAYFNYINGLRLKPGTIYFCNPSGGKATIYTNGFCLSLAQASLTKRCQCG